MIRTMEKVLFLPKYSSKAASSRYRIYSYLPYYKKAGVDFSVHPLLGNWYIDALWNHRSKFLILPQLICAYLGRIFRILTIDKNTIVYIGADVLPYFPPVLEWFMHIRGIKYILELDDAIFHRYDDSSYKIVRLLLGRKFCYVIKWASFVVCGCGYLADYCREWNKKVTIIPTSIDENKYKNVKHDFDSERLIVGWIGSPVTSKYVLQIIPFIKELQKNVNFEFRLIGFDKTYENSLAGCNYKIIQWDSNTELEYLNTFSIGVMPLDDSLFSRGKCAFKLVQYMAVGIPTVSAPLQSNIEIDKGCGNLFASTPDEWKSCLKKLLSDKTLRYKIGNDNKKVCEKYYTFQNNYSKYLEVINSVIN